MKVTRWNSRTRGRDFPVSPSPRTRIVDTLTIYSDRAGRVYRVANDATLPQFKGWDRKQSPTRW